MDIRNIISLLGSTVKGIWITKRERDEFAYAYAFGFAWQMLTKEQQDKLQTVNLNKRGLYYMPLKHDLTLTNLAVSPSIYILVSDFIFFLLFFFVFLQIFLLLRLL